MSRDTKANWVKKMKEEGLYYTPPIQIRIEEGPTHGQKIKSRLRLSKENMRRKGRRVRNAQRRDQSGEVVIVKGRKRKKPTARRYRKKKK